MSKAVIRLNPNSGSLGKTLDKLAKQAIMPEVIKKIGAEGRGSSDTIRGLPPDLEELLMPKILGISKSTPDYDLRVRDFWAEFGFKVSHHGLTLDYSTESREVTFPDGSKRVVNMPKNLDDYMKYFFAMQSSMVAKTEEEKENNSFYDFILEDSAEAKKKQIDLLEVQDIALKHYLTLATDLKKNEDMVDSILELFLDKKNMDTNSVLDIRSNMDIGDKKIQLARIKDTYPDKLNALVEDKNTKIKAEISMARKLGVLKLEGSTYFLEGHDAPIASSHDEMIGVFKDQSKTLEVSKIRAKLEHIKKAK